MNYLVRGRVFLLLLFLYLTFQFGSSSLTESNEELEEEEVIISRALSSPSNLPVRFYINTATTLLANALGSPALGYLNLPVAFSVSFDIFPTGTLVSYASIIHLTSGNVDYGPGARVPGKLILDLTLFRSR